jgi:hypothetical protein
VPKPKFQAPLSIAIVTAIGVLIEDGSPKRKLW